ncbi:MAG: cytochrome c maturation protein CcmE [SAR86 cluster bacterium]|jgi:cytochrome c-type biogenesis protein CcmE|nr:cytochrome c maturation protein CcmE [SAR86 cluster bacterium]MDG1681379.1 cytochrome c maturation protein CcmE [SAR86 cluster bacterium]|tara:strand:+ start:2917 stop:3342 length:426 start_codon:yes stop_codon:yes gene_type:complete
MNPIRKQRLYALIAVLIGSLVATWLVVSALSENMNLFYSPTEIKDAKVDEVTLIRAGGMVKEDSIIKDTRTLNVTFTVTDYQNDLEINYEGILPDLFAENAGVVVRGNLKKDGTFKAIEVLAKHDENYMPPEVAKLINEDL